jgi:asparagine synthase (glutamine-hydrolysing)
MARPYQYCPTVLRNKWLPALVGQLPRLRSVKRIVQTLPISDPGRRYATWLIVFTPEMQAELLQPDIYTAVADYDVVRHYPHYYAHLNSATAADHINRLMYMDLKSLLPDAYLEKVDKAAMACSLETRLPMLDHRLVELAFQIPSGYKVIF